MRVLATSTPGRGHLNCLLPLLSALQHAGHDVLVVTAAESCAFVERSGFAVREGGLAADERRGRYASRLAETMALPPRQRRGRFYAGYFADIAAPVMQIALAPVLQEFGPDVVVHEIGELAAAPMSVARGIPHVTVAFSGMLPMESDDMVLDHLAPVWAVEALQAPTMDAVRGDLYLHPFPPAFAQYPPGDAVRPMRAEAFDGVVEIPPPWLESLGVTRPLAYITSGTEPIAAIAPWAAAFEALGSLDIDVVATIGARLDAAVLGTVPDNIRVERFVPQQFVLDRAAVAMSHAGAGSLLGAARHGLPQLLYPIAADQWQNADAAAVAGVGIALELDQRSADDFAAALDRLLGDEVFTATASHVAAEIAAMPSPADHVATIEALAEGRST
ncbi:MAG: glycosyltransferase [Ilumatobacteraceae bacterium]